MKKFAYPFWAKKREKNSLPYWLPLSIHLEDTRGIAGVLWEQWLGDGQRNLIENSLDDDSKGKGKNLIQFLAAVHDIGKATPAFQKKEGYDNSKDLNFALLEKLEQAGFNGINELVLASSKHSPHNIAGQFLLFTYGVNSDISTIIGGHHGKPVDTENDYKKQFAYKANYFQSENRESYIYKKWEKSQRDIFNWALETSGFEKVEDLPRIKQPAQVILSGLLIMSDWIASNEDYFPLFPINEEDFIQKNRLEIGFSKWKKSNIWDAEYVSDFKNLYKKRFGFKPRNVQSILSEVIDKTENPGIFILEAPMGVGKTEAALIASEQLAYKTGRNGIFFGLPTQATSDGIFPRINTWLKCISEDLGERVQLRLSHGKAHLNKDFNSLARGINIDDSREEGVIVNEWFSARKKTALDDFVVGTVDQFLMVALKQKHLALRHLGFSKKVVIIDEVHAYDAYMSQYLLEAIKWMGAYNVPVVILSATLPAEKRIDLLKNYMLGIGKKWKRDERIKRDKDLKTDAYPLITYNDGYEVYQIRQFEKIKDKNIKILKLDETNLVNTVNEMISDGGIIGIIVNTVKKAQDIAIEFSKIFGKDMVELLHSSFISTSRIEKEKNLLKMIGKDANRPNQKIIIGTQVIEQSLDIDFDVMISDLCPMDLLIQRIGRLHRHDKTERPKQHEEPVFYILGTNDDFEFEKGSSFVYGDYLLARTQHFLPESINLPSDISQLVQKVYGFDLKSKEDGLNLDDSLKEKYNTYKDSYKALITRKESKAKNYKISDPVLKKRSYAEDNLIGWIQNPSPNQSEEKAYAQVRDITDTIEVIALKKVEDGYGLFPQNLNICGKIDDKDVARNIAKNTLRLPNILTRPYNIDKTIEILEKYNHRYLGDWQSSSWLKGCLGIIFDENNEFTIGDIKIIYSEDYGVKVERM